jgi:hypothetical protein
VVVGRARYDRLLLGTTRDSAGLANGTLALEDLPRIRLRRIAAAELGETSVRAARELVRIEPGRLRRRAARRGDRGLAALRILARGESPHAFDALAEARARGGPKVIGGLVAIAAELDSREADEFLLSVLVAGDHPRSRTVTELAPRAPRLLDELLGLARQPDGAIRYWALMLLANAASEPAVLAAAVEGATDDEASVRGAAARVLGASGSLESLAALRGLLSDDAFFVRAHAVRAVGEIEATSLAPEAAALLADANWWVRAAAKEALFALGDSGYDAAFAMLDDEDRFAREGAADVVFDSGRAANEHEIPSRLLEGLKV